MENQESTLIPESISVEPIPMYPEPTPAPEPFNPDWVMRVEPTTVTTVPASRKLNGTDTTTLKSPDNLGWQIVSSASQTDPFSGVTRNANGSTDYIYNTPTDLSYSGEGVDLITMDGGDSIAISDHPEWLSTKYGATRFVEQDWTQYGNLPTITGTLVGANWFPSVSGTSEAYVFLPGSVASQFLTTTKTLSVTQAGVTSSYVWETENRVLTITGGQGAGQSRIISGLYASGSNYIGYIRGVWDIATEGTAQAGGASSITLAASTVGADGAFVGYQIYITAGTGAGGQATITAYTASTKVATISGSWTTAPASGSAYKVLIVPTSSSTFSIAGYAQPADYYNNYISDEHGTGTLALAGGKTYGFAKESTLRSIGAHSIYGTRLFGGNNGAFSFSGSTITSTNSTIRTRLSYLSAGSTIWIFGATTSTNNGECIVLSNTDDGTSRTVTMKNVTFTSEPAVSGTSISQARGLWNIISSVELVRQFHLNKPDKTRPTVFVPNLTVAATYTGITQASTVFSNGTYAAINLTTTAGINSAANAYFVPPSITSDTFLSVPDPAFTEVLNNLVTSGVVVVAGNGNSNQRAVSSTNAAYNDYICVPGTTTVTSGTARAGSNSTTIVLATGASSVDGTYVDTYIKITSGTGSGQNRVITAFVGATRTATVATPWTTTPTSTSVYSIVNNYKLYQNRATFSGTPDVVISGAIWQKYISNMEYRASYSSSGPLVDVWAPADATITASFDVPARTFWDGVRTNPTTTTTYPYNSSYLVINFSGTSASTPIVGGVLACMAQARPWMDSGAAKAQIQDTGTKNRLYTPTPDVFSNQASLGGAPNNYLWYPFTHLSDT